jgi:hypothetical protein
MMPMMPILGNGSMSFEKLSLYSNSLLLVRCLMMTALFVFVFVNKETPWKILEREWSRKDAKESQQVMHV